MTTLALNSFMNSLLSEIFDTSAVISLSKVIALSRPKSMEKIRKFSQEDLSNAFYQLLNSASDLGHVKADYLPHHGYLAILQHAQHPGADIQGYINMILTGIAVAAEGQEGDNESPP